MRNVTSARLRRRLLSRSVRRQLVMVAGFVVVIAGVAMVFIPAALIAAGFLLVLAGIEVPE